MNISEVQFLISHLLMCCSVNFINHSKIKLDLWNFSYSPFCVGGGNANNKIFFKCNRQNYYSFANNRVKKRFLLLYLILLHVLPKGY